MERRFYTVENGQVSRIQGYEFIHSTDYNKDRGDRLEDATGSVTVADATNTRSSVIAFRPDQWYWVKKRELEMSIEYVPISDAYRLVMHSRVGLVNRTGSKSLATMGYNINPNLATAA